MPAAVSSRHAAALQAKLRAACENKVVRWAWAKGDLWPTTPLRDQRLKLRPARTLAREPARPPRDTYACGFDGKGRMLAKRWYTSTGVAEWFFAYRGDVVDEHYFFDGEPRCTVTRYLHAKGRLVGLVHVYEDGDLCTARFTWKAGRLAKLVSRGAGHDYDELFEHDANGLVRIERVFKDGRGGRDEVFRRARRPTRASRAAA